VSAVTLADDSEPRASVAQWRDWAAAAPTTQVGVRDLAMRLRAEGEIDSLLAAASAWREDADSAARLVIAATTLGHAPRAADVVPLFPLVESPLTFVALVAALAPDERAPALVEALEQGHLSSDRDALACVLATLALPPGEPPPPRLLRQTRLTLGDAARRGSYELHLMLTVATLHGDEASVRFVVDHLDVAARGEHPDEQALALPRMWLTASALDVLPEGAAPTPSAPLPSAAPSRPRVGRNDPCWCGSGKKYKRCHLGRGSDAPPRAPTTEPPPPLPSRAHVPVAPTAEEVFGISLPTLMRVDLDRLDGAALAAAARRFAAFGCDDRVDGVLGLLHARGDAGLGAAATEQVERLIGVGAVAAARDLLARGWCPDGERERLEELLAIAHGPTGYVARLESWARRALEGGDAALDLVGALEAQAPALALLVARNAIDTGEPDVDRVAGGKVLELRARLGRSLFDRGLARALEAQALRGAGGRAASDGDGLSRAQGEVDRLAAEIAEQQAKARALARELAEQRAERERAERISQRAREQRDALAAAAAARDGERRGAPDLKAKLAAVEATLRERNAQRRQLEARLRRLEREATGGKRDAPGPERGDADAPDRYEDAGPPLAGIRFPSLGKHVEEVIRGRPREGARALTLLGQLAAGAPQAWQGIKKLRGFRGLLEARIGIHHRLLFAVEGDRLEVIDLVTREDLEQTLQRLRDRGL